MTQAKVNELAATLRNEGKSETEIRSALFRTKGVRVAQIIKALES
jgi:hypothetical protein